MNTVSIISPSFVSWHEYRALRLRALKEEPQAFLFTSAAEAEYPDSKWIERLEEARSGKGSLLVFARQDKTLVGMVGAWQPDADKAKNRVNLYGMYVAPEARGKGVAKLLIEHILLQLKKRTISSVTLTVNTDQKKAIALYKNLGFVIVGRDKEILGDGKLHDECVMERLTTR